MSSPEYDLNRIRENLGIPDSLDDPKLIEWADQGSLQFDNDLFEYSDSFPLTGDDLKVKKDAVSAWVKMSWFSFKGNKEKADSQLKIYELLRNSLRTKFRKTPSGRSIGKRVGVSTEYQTTPLYSQTRKL